MIQVSFLPPTSAECAAIECHPTEGDLNISDRRPERVDATGARGL